MTLPLSPQSMESQVEEWYREVGELQAQTAALPLEPASKELVGERQNAVGERLVRLLEPLQERRRLLLASKELHQVAHDLDDELVRLGAGIRGGIRITRGGARDLEVRGPGGVGGWEAAGVGLGARTGRGCEWRALRDSAIHSLAHSLFHIPAHFQSLTDSSTKSLIYILTRLFFISSSTVYLLLIIRSFSRIYSFPHSITP